MVKIDYLVCPGKGDKANSDGVRAERAASREARNGEEIAKTS